MKCTLPPKRKVFPNVKGFLQRHPELKFDEDSFFASLDCEKELDQAWQEFKKHFSKIPVKPNYHSQKALLSKHPLYQSEPLTPLTKKDLRQKGAFNEQIAPKGRQWFRYTSGTSGKSFQVTYSSVIYFTSLFQTVLRSLIRAGIHDVNQREVFSLFVTDNSHRHEEILVDPVRRTGLQVCLRVRSSEPEDSLRVYEFMQNENPEVFTCKPHLIDKMIYYWKEKNLKVPCQLKAIVSAGSTLSPELRKVIENYFNAPVVNVLNTTELGHVAAECEKNIFHVDQSHVFLEANDEGELFATSLTNECMPLWKYSMGDLGKLEITTCECGAKGLLIKEFSGRKLISFNLSNGKILTPSAWMNIFRDIPELEEYQVTQETKNQFSVKIETEARLKAQVLEKVKCYLAKDLPRGTRITLSLSQFPKHEKFARFRTEVL